MTNPLPFYFSIRCPFFLNLGPTGPALVLGLSILSLSYSFPLSRGRRGTGPLYMKKCQNRPTQWYLVCDPSDAHNKREPCRTLSLSWLCSVLCVLFFPTFSVFFRNCSLSALPLPSPFFTLPSLFPYLCPILLTLFPLLYSPFSYTYSSLCLLPYSPFPKNAFSSTIHFFTLFPFSHFSSPLFPCSSPIPLTFRHLPFFPSLTALTFRPLPYSSFTWNIFSSTLTFFPPIFFAHFRSQVPFPSPFSPLPPTSLNNYKAKFINKYTKIH